MNSLELVIHFIHQAINSVVNRFIGSNYGSIQELRQIFS